MIPSRQRVEALLWWCERRQHEKTGAEAQRLIDLAAILTAVNSHEKLVEMVERALTALELCQQDSDAVPADELLSDIRALLTSCKREGEKT